LVSSLTRQGPSLGALAFQQLHHSKHSDCILISRHTSFELNDLNDQIKLTSTYFKMWVTLNFHLKLSSKVSFDLKTDLVNILSKGKSIIYLRANNKANYTNTFGTFFGILLYEIHKLILYRADVVFALSNTMKEEYRTIPKIYKKIKIVPNFIDQRVRFDLKKKINSFLIVASLTPRKRVIETVESFIAEFEYNSDVSLTVIGDGILRPLLEKMIKKCNCEFKITYIRDSIDPGPYFATHEYFILMSQSEGLSRASLEASNSGCKLLLSNIDVHREYFGDISILINDFDDLRKVLRDCYCGKNSTLSPAFPLFCAQSYIWSTLKKF